MWYLLPSLQDPGRPRVFQIGFNRCGTKSIAVFFHRNGYRAAHWQKGVLAAGMEVARRRGEPLLRHVAGFDVYTDMERVAQRRAIPHGLERRLDELQTPDERRRPVYAFKHFRQLDRQYPGSKFVLNVRDVDRWVESRLRFEADDGGDYRFCVHGERAHPDEEALAACWRSEWRRHLRDVRSYFAGRDDDLLVFDIDEDAPTEFARFFEGTRWTVDPGLWPWANRSRPAGGGGASGPAGGDDRGDRDDLGGGGLRRLGVRMGAAVTRARRSLRLGA